MEMNLAKNRNPYVIALVAWTIVLLAVGVFLFEWRYRLSYDVPNVVRYGDKGFRFNLNKRKCVDQDGVAGISRNFLGPCGVAEGISLKRSKIENRILIAGTITSSNMTDVLFEWVKAHGMRWSDIEFHSGKIVDSEFPLAEFHGVKFENVDFRGVNFNGAKFFDCQFKNSRFRDANFRGANIVRSVFIGSDCAGCDFTFAKFEDSSIQGRFESAYFNFQTVLPFPINQISRYGFEYRDGL